MMTRDDYEAQKRRLAEQHKALVEMVDAAHQDQLRALEIVWRMMSGEGPAVPLPAPAASPQPVPPAPPAKRRLQPGELLHNVFAALSRLPDSFTFADVLRELGYEPDRGSLYRVLQDLRLQGHIVIQKAGTGNRPTRYRRAHASSPPAGS